MFIHHPLLIIIGMPPAPHSIGRPSPGDHVPKLEELHGMLTNLGQLAQ